MQPKIGHLIIYTTHFGLFLSSYKADYVYVVICYVTKRRKKLWYIHFLTIAFHLKEICIKMFVLTMNTL